MPKFLKKSIVGIIIQWLNKLEKFIHQLNGQSDHFLFHHFDSHLPLLKDSFVDWFCRWCGGLLFCCRSGRGRRVVVKLLLVGLGLLGKVAPCRVGGEMGGFDIIFIAIDERMSSVIVTMNYVMFLLLGPHSVSLPIQLSTFAFTITIVDRVHLSTNKERRGNVLSLPFIVLNLWFPLLFIKVIGIVLFL